MTAAGGARRLADMISQHTRRIAAAGLAAAAAAALFAGPAPAASAGTQADAAPRLGHRLQAILDRAVRSPETPFPATALHVRLADGTTWSGAAGKARLRPARRMRPNDRIRAGSILKPFVAAATLQLVEEGRFGLDDPLPAVLPADVPARFPEADRITVRMLLNHTSGLAEYSDPGFDRLVAANPLRVWNTSELLDRTAGMPRAGAPGERFSYSNANYNLLGLVIERATGKPWRAVVRERVIERLRLRRTSLPRPGHVPHARDIAHGYAAANGRLRDVSDVDSSMAGAAGGHAMLSTTGDLSRFLRGLLAGKLFERRSTLDEMRSFVPASSPEGRVGYGLGLERYVLPGGIELVGHTGGTAGYLTLMEHLPAQDIDISMTITAGANPLPVLVPALQVLLAEAA
jgi:D-alanyl-D-alanine carboxypeptidase